MKISVFGLGKLGAPLAAVLASRGHTVIGVDLSERAVDSVSRGESPVFETGLAELISASRANLSATSDGRRAVRESDLTFIVVATPSDSSGRFSLAHVTAAIRSIGQALAEKETWHTVVVTSTVMPGDTEGVVLPLLEQCSGRRVGRDVGLCYNPEFIALGSVIRDMLQPDMVLIGESDERSGGVLQGLYESLYRENERPPAVCRMSLVNAELTKLAVNTFITTKISYANMVAQVCEKLPGADADVVTRALGKDSRIGPKYLKGAVAYGGPCFPRDNLAFAALAREIGAPATLAEATDEFNRRRGRSIAALVAERLGPERTVAVLGLSYKPHTDVVIESPGTELARDLAAEGARVSVFDPAAMESARRTLGEGVSYAGTMQECVAGAEVVVIMTPWPEFRGLLPGQLVPADAVPHHRPVVFDCWRMLDSRAFEGAAEYVALGCGTGAV